MSFNTALSGLRAATSDLNVTGNNISNASSVGFKQSRAEFASVYSASIMGSGENTVGGGVVLKNVSQLFDQGNLTYTQNALDLAINGNGFFQMSNNGAISYTRTGYFGTDREGYIVDSAGFNLQGFITDANGELMDGGMANLRIQPGGMSPKATTQLVQGFNLNAASAIPLNTPFNSLDATTYNSSTSTNIFDSQGSAHTLNQYFTKTSDPNVWTMHTLIDGVHPMAGPANSAALEMVRLGGSGQNVLDAALNAIQGSPDLHNAISTYVGPLVGATPVPSAEQVLAAVVSASATPVSLNITFDTGGKLKGFDGVYDPNSGVPPTATDYWTLNPDGTVTLRQWDPASLNNEKPAFPVDNGAIANLDGVRLDMRSATQYASAFAVNSVSQDGYSTGELAGIEIDSSGFVLARFTNGQTAIQGQVILADFANIQGLTPIGNTHWTQSYASGEPIRNPPGVGSSGSVQSGALEDSNVDLPEQLVNLIIAQRNYQANAKAIETESTLSQTVINLR